jgi:hypothetical protein
MRFADPSRPGFDSHAKKQLSRLKLMESDSHPKTLNDFNFNKIKDVCFVPISNDINTKQVS